MNGKIGLPAALTFDTDAARDWDNRRVEDINRVLSATSRVIVGIDGVRRRG
jgi:hypothetical protein